MKQTDLEKLLADMSLKEKVDQMLQLSGAFYLFRIGRKLII